MTRTNKLLASLAAAAAFGTAFAIVGMPQARAADLGGNCCADLEERVAELEATTARKGGRKVTLTVSGQVNEALLWVDTPAGSRKSVINNTNDQTRFRFVGEAKINATWSAGYLLEMGTAVADYSGAAKYDVGIRHSAWWLENKDLGRVWVGKTSTATDGIAEIDLTQTYIASTRLSLDPLSGAYLAGAALPFDGNREEIVKYTSPIFAGFTASAAWYTNRNDAWDASLRYAGEFSGVRIGAGIGYRKEDDARVWLTSKAETFNASGSMMHVASGLFLNASYGDMSGATASTTISLADVKAMHVQAGIERKLTDIGATTFYAEWAQLKDKNGSGSTDMWGAGVVQGIDAAAMSLYVGYRDYQDYNTRTLVMGGIIKF